MIRTQEKREDKEENTAERTQPILVACLAFVKTHND